MFPVTRSNVPSAWPVLLWAMAADWLSDWSGEAFGAGHPIVGAVLAVLAFWGAIEAVAKVHAIRQAGEAR